MDRLNYNGLTDGTVSTMAKMNAPGNGWDITGKIDSIIDYSSKVGEGAGIAFDRTLDNPGETLSDIGVGLLQGVPRVVQGAGDLTGVETPASDSLYDYLDTLQSGNSPTGQAVSQELAGLYSGNSAAKVGVVTGKVANSTGRAAVSAYKNPEVKKLFKDSSNILGGVLKGNLQQALYHDPLSVPKLIKDSVNASTRTIQKNWDGIQSMKDSFKINKASPGIVDTVKPTSGWNGSGPYSGMSTGFPMKGSHANDVIIMDKDLSKAKYASTLRHEYDHSRWRKKYLSLKDVVPDKNKIPTKWTDEEIKYLSSPTEVNARGRQMQNIYAKIKSGNSTNEDIAILYDKIIETSPFNKEFNKLYPDEMGSHIARGSKDLNSWLNSNHGELTVSNFHKFLKGM